MYQIRRREYREYVIPDTSPSLGILNKIIISTVDGFFLFLHNLICLVRMELKNSPLELWQKNLIQFIVLISEDKKKISSSKFVQFFLQFIMPKICK
jgi:hypothetical protein